VRAAVFVLPLLAVLAIALALLVSQQAAVAAVVPVVLAGIASLWVVRFG
jgi:hypothetical protein